MEVLQNLHGIYSVAIDAEKGTVKVSGKVNPNLVLRILQNNGKHAEVLFMRFDGEVVEDHFNFYCHYHGAENGFCYINNINPHIVGVTHPYPFLMGPGYPFYERAGPHFLPPPLLPPPPPPPRPRPPPPSPPPPVSDYPSSVPKEVASPPTSKREPQCRCSIM
ncbi:hypothetical protein ACOSQ3_030678 [Xanthoceras sorbifolium]